MKTTQAYEDNNGGVHSTVEKCMRANIGHALKRRGIDDYEVDTAAKIVANYSTEVLTVLLEDMSELKITSVKRHALAAKAQKFAEELGK